MTEVATLLNSNRRRCFTLIHSQPDPSGGDRFTVALVFENEPGYFPTGGNGAPWFWTQATVDEQNKTRFGLTPSEVAKIIASSMFPKKK